MLLVSVLDSNSFTQVPNKARWTLHKDLTLSIVLSYLHPCSSHATFLWVKICLEEKEIRIIRKIKTNKFLYDIEGNDTVAKVFIAS